MLPRTVSLLHTVSRAWLRETFKVPYSLELCNRLSVLNRVWKHSFSGWGGASSLLIWQGCKHYTPKICTQHFMATQGRSYIPQLYLTEPSSQLNLAMFSFGYATKSKVTSADFWHTSQMFMNDFLNNNLVFCHETLPTHSRYVCALINDKVARLFSPEYRLKQRLFGTLHWERPTEESSYLGLWLERR